MIVLAPSSTGKTWFCLNNTGKAPFGVLIDGDAIVSQYVGWPDAPGWWRDKKLAPLVHAGNALAIRAYLNIRPDVTVLFNGDLATVVDLVAACVLPSLADIEAHAKAKKSRGSKQPTDPVELKVNLEHVAIFAADNAIRTFPDLPAACSHARTRRMYRT